VAGFASWHNWCIVVNLEAEWREILRHELAHIFGGRWNPQAPVVLREGLAVWAQRTARGYPVDYWARLMLSDPADALEFLIGPEPAIGSMDRHRFYPLAGSFTAALIRRFGLPRYKGFYRDRTVTQAAFQRKFERHFMLSLRCAVDGWLTDLAVRQARRSPLLFSR
jgi:hypothetical protein